MKGTGVFRREDMGTVKVSLDFSYGKHSVHAVAGKKSQDTYANVFLIEEKRDEEQRIIYKWEEKQRVIYEYGHQKTQTKNKNLNPVFQEKFVFQTDTNILKDITKKSLVISIWDEDSNSRDDYMAGITVPLKYVDRFKKLNTEVDIQLHVQEMDGYVSLFSFKSFLCLIVICKDWKLVVQGIAVSDSGEYQCQVTWIIKTFN